MSPEKEAVLIKKFPHLFRDHTAPLTQSLMAFGFECNDGWYDLLYEAASKIEPILVKMINDATRAKDFEALNYIPAASQIKEKFGTLRFYMTYSTDEIEKIIRKAERKSATTCEQCGAKGKLRGKSWVFTVCSKCWKKYKVERGIV